MNGTYRFIHEGSEIEEVEVDNIYFRNLLEQLQAYKDKEDKLKKLCNDDYFNENYTGDFIEELLQILNEGDNNG